MQAQQGGLPPSLQKRVGAAFSSFLPRLALIVFPLLLQVLLQPLRWERRLRRMLLRAADLDGRKRSCKRVWRGCFRMSFERETSLLYGIED